MMSILYKMGENIMMIIHIYGARGISYYFFITNTLSWSKYKWNLVHLNPYAPRKIPQALRDQDISPLQHGLYLI